MLETITHLVTNFGYVIVAAFILLECAGFPIPGETALLVAAGFAGAGKLSIVIVIITAATAGILGNAGGYWLGRFLGRGFVERFGKYVGLNRKRMTALEGFFVKHGAIAVFFGRFVGVLRTYSALFAGISRMPYLLFTIFNTLGGIVWACVFGAIGYAFGQNIGEIENMARIFGWGALFGVIIIGAGWYVRRWVTAVPSSREAEEKAQGVGRFFKRLMHGSPLVSMRNGKAHLSRLAVTVLFCVGFLITVLMVMFVSTATHGLPEYDPMVRFEEIASTAIDSWLSRSQSLILLAIAKSGAIISVTAALLTAIIFFLVKKPLYTFTLLFALAGGETLSALIAYLNRGYGVFVSSHMSVRLTYLLVYDNVIVPMVMFGMLAYLAVLPTKQMLSAFSVIVAFGILAIATAGSGFLCGLHGGVEFFEELLCAVVWLWICIGLTGFIRLRRQQHDALRLIDESNS
jgi:membrane protein DedA with SNARE-associated domain